MLSCVSKLMPASVLSSLKTYGAAVVDGGDTEATVAAADVATDTVVCVVVSLATLLSASVWPSVQHLAKLQWL